MKTFEELQNIWNQQTTSETQPTAAEIIKKAELHTKKIKRGHLWTRIILSLTSIILIFYFIWSGAYRNIQFSIGLFIMIVMLVSRVALEWISVKKLANLNTDLTLIEYSKLAHQFYTWRKKIHYILTPIIYLTYTAGFTLLLPVFKSIFSLHSIKRIYFSISFCIFYDPIHPKGNKTFTLLEKYFVKKQLVIILPFSAIRRLQRNLELFLFISASVEIYSVNTNLVGSYPRRRSTKKKLQIYLKLFLSTPFVQY